MWKQLQHEVIKYVPQMEPIFESRPQRTPMCPRSFGNYNVLYLLLDYMYVFQSMMPHSVGTQEYVTHTAAFIQRLVLLLDLILNW